MTDKQQQILTSTLENVKLPANDLIELLEIRSEEAPDKVLYYYLEDGYQETERQTYKEMRDRVVSIAGTLQKLAVKGERVMLLFPSEISFINALYGCFYAGLTGVPAYAPRKNRSFERFKAILEGASPRIIIATRKIHDDIIKNFNEEPCFQGIDFLIYEEIIENKEYLWEKPKVFPDDIALLQYTSGSTGIPNGVMLSHSNIIHNSEFIKKAFGHDESLMGVNWIPGFHDMGLIGALIQPLYMGGSNVIIPPGSFLTRPYNFLKSIGKYKGTTAGGPNFALNHCVEQVREEHKPEIDLSSLNPLYCGAEPIRKASLDRFAAYFSDCGFTPDKFYPCYGLAESTLIVTGGNLEDEPIFFYADPEAIRKGKVKRLPPDSPDAMAFTACGFPMLGTRVLITDPETHAVCNSGEIGEIWAGGPSIAKGYWNNAEATEKTFNAFTASGDGPFMRTGDLGFIEDGQLYISGRLKDLIIIRGMNHYPQDIEATVEDSHEVLMQSSCAAFAIESEDEEKLVVVQEVKRAFLRKLNEEEVFSAIRQSIADNHQLQVYAIVLTKTGSIPKTSSGKIQHFECRNAFLNNTLKIIASWTLPDKEPEKSDEQIDEKSVREWIKNWMAKELKLSPGEIEIDKPITSYGLDSLKAVILARDAEDRFGVEWPLDAFLEETTIEKLTREGLQRLHDV